MCVGHPQDLWKYSQKIETAGWVLGSVKIQSGSTFLPGRYMSYEILVVACWQSYDMLDFVFRW